MEHVLQDLTVASEVRFPGLEKVLRPVSQRFRMEEGAMMAEWEKISLLPEDLRLRVVDEVKNDSKLDKRSKHLLLSLYDEPSTSVEDYIQRQRDLDRYSWDDVRAAYRPYKVVMYGPISAMAATLVGVASSCIVLIDKSGNYSGNSVFFRHVCLNIYPVQLQIRSRRKNSGD